MATKVNKTTLDISQFLREDEDTETLTITIKDVETKWEYRQLSWYEKNQCVSKATTIIPSETGPTFGFDIATYYTEALQRMLVSAPIPITPVTLRSLKDEVGSILQTIVPQPLDESAGEATKKESEES